MIAFGHTAVGSLVGLAGYSVFENLNPVSGLVLTGVSGIVSHYITDAIPHGHYFSFSEFKKKAIYAIIFDFLFSVLIFMSAAYLSHVGDLKILYIFFGISGAQLPDILDGLIHTGFLPKKGILKKECRFHQLTHWHGRKEKGLMFGIYDIWQLSVVLVSLVLIVS